MKLARKRLFHFEYKGQKFLPDIGFLLHDALEDLGIDPKHTGDIVHNDALDASLKAGQYGNPFNLNPYLHSKISAVHRQAANSYRDKLREALARGDNSQRKQLTRQIMAHDDAADAHQTAHEVMSHRAQQPELQVTVDRAWKEANRA